MNRVQMLLVALLAGVAGLLCGGCVERASIAPERLACEFRTNPEGIAAVRPRLSWRLHGSDAEERGVFMSAYRVVAASSPTALASGASLWDSGVVRRGTGDGDELPLLATRAEWGGEPLKSRNKVWWRVKVWDQQGRESGWSEPASFSIGLLGQGDWTGQWIGLDETAPAPLTADVREELKQRPWICQIAPIGRTARKAWFRSEFDLTGEVVEAWLAGTADTVGDVTVNGVAVGQLARWESVRPIDVRAPLKPGRNSIGIAVEQFDGFSPAVTGMLVVRMRSGHEQRVLLDKTWKTSVTAAEGWDRAGFNDQAWASADESRGQPWGSSRNTEHFMPRAPYLRTTFGVDAGKRVERATLYATALGLYECRLNGAKVGGDEFAPGWTEYAKRVEHRTYDVTGMVHAGENCLGAVVGDGWYAGLMGYTGQRRYYHGPARFMGQLEIEYADGTRQVVATGPSWRAGFGPILHTDNYMGSAYDARLEAAGWDTAAFDATGWRAAEVGLQRQENWREADVTSRVRAAMRDGKVEMRVVPQTLGDPAYGVVKVLRVEYTLGRRSREVTVREGAVLSLPGPNEGGELAITKAVFGAPAGELLAAPAVEPAMSEPVRRFEELPARTVSEPRPGRYVFDLGQNMVGWVRLRASGSAGQRLVVRHAEMLNPDGTLYTSNLRGATAADFFTLKGGVTETLEPPFTFHGFRYVEVTGLAAKPGPEMVTGIVAHSDIAPAGSFSCSSPLVNQLVHNIVWGQKGNYFEVPTDCPQRDERLGWTGDAQFFVNTAAYSFDVSSFMARWLKTLAQDAQFEDGTFAHVAPKVNERGGSTAWGDAAIVCTHALYTTYGDTRAVADNYDAMKRYMAWLDTKTKDGIAHVGGFGDWLNLDDPTSSDLIDTAYRAELYRLMSEMARALGRHEDAARFKGAHERTTLAFQQRFLDADGALKQSGQTGYALAFTMGLIPQDLHEKTAAHFAAAIERKKWHLATGFIGTPRLLPGLHGAGDDSTAARLLLNEDYPSWLYQVKLGATTMWERWDGWTPERGFSDVGMNSFNHYAFGSVGDYLYRHVAGIAPLEPGYARVLIAPTPVAGLDHAEAVYDSVAGKITSAWKRVPGGVEFDITVPPNGLAEIWLPTLSNAGVSENGHAAVASAGLHVLPPLDGGPAGTVRFAAVSGRYRFTVKPAR
jgi:alpha-L-rhamnosidase